VWLVTTDRSVASKYDFRTEDEFLV
jgi:hypothetical protein